MKTIFKVALAIFKDKKLLQVRSKKHPEVFFTLGGKIEQGESDIDCLKREVKEEINCDIDQSSIRYLTTFEDIAHSKEESTVNIKMYTGKLIGDPQPTSEIAEIGYFDINAPKKNLSTIAQRTIFPWLKQHGYIN
ncbi:MAG: NUDIX domain-containing protein [Candidatus Daviesbacteria bacterium]|nr:NUDIX domain-containing protein [Candidatus Daviesbacteria bacterium]